jgi:hypothetical protein
LSLLLPYLKERFEKVVSNLANIRDNHVDKARSILKTLLGPEILLHPSSNGEERFLTAEMSGSYAGLMRLTIDKNKGWWRAPTSTVGNRLAERYNPRDCADCIPIGPAAHVALLLVKRLGHLCVVRHLVV